MISPAECSQNAAETVKPYVNRLRQRVYDLIKSAGYQGLTDEMIQHQLRMNANTERPRRVELVKSGKVKAGTFRYYTSSGRPATAWVAI